MTFDSVQEHKRTRKPGLVDPDLLNFSGYRYYTPVTIQSSKVLADHSNFPFVISGTFDGTGGEADLRTAANGGHIENTDLNGGASSSLIVPADFVVSPNQDGSSPWNHEFEKYDPITGEIVVWVKNPSMDSSSDETIYMVYGDSGVTTSQENVAGVWSNNFLAVYHLSETSAPYYDSLSNHDSVSGSHNDPIRTDGIVGYGQDFDGNNNKIVIPDHSNLDLASGFTIMVAINWDGGNPAGDKRIVSKNVSSWRFRTGGAETVHFEIDSVTDLQDPTSISADTDYIYHGTWNGSNNAYLYRDGSQIDSGSGSGIGTNSEDVVIGYEASGVAADDYWSGLMDEVRISTVARSINWVETEYNSFDVSTFLSFGSESTN